MVINISIKEIPRIPIEIKEFFEDRQEMLEEYQELCEDDQIIDLLPINVSWRGKYNRVKCVGNEILISLVDFDKMRVMAISINKKWLLDRVML